MPKKVIQLTVPASLRFSALIRSIAEEIFGLDRFSSGWRSRLKLVVDELFMNAVKYGSLENDGKVYLTFSYDDSEIEFTVEDEGKGLTRMNPEELKKKITVNEGNHDLTKTSGRGLAMITEKWVDKFEISSSPFGGIKIVCSKKNELSQPPAVSIVKVEPSKTEAPVQPKSGKVFEILFSGEIDSLNIDESIAPAYAQAERLGLGDELVLNLKNINYINSLFIGYLAALYNQVKPKKAFLKLINIKSEVRDILDLVGLTKVVEVQ